MWKIRIIAIFLLVTGILVGYFNYVSQMDIESSAYKPFSLGLDLSGGTHLVYRADVSSIPPEEVKTAMDSLRDIIERRVNIFGVSEPIVQVKRAGIFAEGEDEGSYKLIVELPGITDVKTATEMIGATPVLEFMTPKQDIDFSKYEEDLAILMQALEKVDPAFVETGYDITPLTGRFLQRASLAFDHTTGEAYVLLDFNKEGKKLFADITRENIGKPVAIFLDRNLGNVFPITKPTVREVITGGQAQITGNFTAEEARVLVGRLNSGALPVDELELISTQTIGATLGVKAINSGVNAAILGLGLVGLFLIIWYRLAGVIAVLALSMYIAIMLALFKLIPVTLTAAGVAGFILSIGMAVDANILIFERMKEELRLGKKTEDAIREGFARAWLSIRDGNISSIITAIILFWFGTGMIKGFALTLGLGIFVSMLSAVIVSRTFLLAIAFQNKTVRLLLKSGIKFN